MKFPLIPTKVYYSIIILVFCVIMIGFGSATIETLPKVTQNTCVDLPQLEFNSTYQTISYIQGPAPNKTMFNISSNMISQGNFYYTYRFCNTSEIGSYLVNGRSDLGVWSYNFPVGNEVSISEAVLYIALILILLGTLAFTFYQVIKPDAASSWRVSMFNISYFIFIVMIFFIWKISSDYLPGISYLSNIIYYVWFIPLIMSWLEILLSIMILVNIGLSRTKAKRLIQMGYSEDEAESRVRRRK